MSKLSIALAVALASPGAAHAATLTPAQIAQRHIEFAQKGDVDAIMGDFADDAVNFTAGKAVQGKNAIRGIFAGMANRKPGEPSPVANMKIGKVWEEGEVGFVTWTMGPVNGTEEFLVRNGKILIQAVFISAPPPAAK
ncbi:nuclear transport factor 2 family protein [Sphingobium nicotianae]|uniref:Nuclear transport factor 2 family protein n=1 Tax=Sphingobium nicotianae TaxID=2782607 RepID=A0A9X1AJ39_9SPHN|nr:nuclear transport factor 2 family protein [Sphingobium nicotianae]MBT2185725.1 nuclear transport factor 2 family protein [Sphingobium nicotianae]